MADVKYCIREFTPTQNQVGMSHTFYAQAVVDNVITNRELARKIEARGLSRAADLQPLPDVLVVNGTIYDKRE